MRSRTAGNDVLSFQPLETEPKGVRFEEDRPMKVWMLALCALILSATNEASAMERIPTANGEIVIATPGERAAYDTYKYAVVRRAGDVVYVSGVVAARDKTQPPSPEAYKKQVRLAFERIKTRLNHFGLGFEHVAMINTYHDWTAPEFKGDANVQLETFNHVKDEFMKPPHAAWTAVGTTGLLGEGGIVEIQMIAHIPPGLANP
jgi:enamine deaminase RidA (YjgF/YER057c/UK114 family)